MGLGIPPLEIKINIESNPLKSIILVGRLAVKRDRVQNRARDFTDAGARPRLIYYTLLYVTILCYNTLQYPII